MTTCNVSCKKNCWLKLILMADPNVRLDDNANPFACQAFLMLNKQLVVECVRNPFYGMFVHDPQECKRILVPL